jgi:hypothetical protein
MSVRAEVADDPTSEEYRIARRVMVYVRKQLEAEGVRLTLSENRIFSEVVMRGSAVCDPALWEQSQLTSAEGLYERPEPEHKTVRRKSGGL